MNPNDFDNLVGETISLVMAEHGKDPFQDSPSTSSIPSDLLMEEEIPESCGLLFRLLKGPSTFRIHCFPSQNLKDDYEELQRGMNQFRDSSQVVHWFETEYFEMAQVITENIGKKIFSLFEGEISSIHDPGLSWWLIDKGDTVKIYLRSQGILGIDQDYERIKLGPLSDHSTSCMRLRESLPFLQQTLSLKDFSCDENALELTTLGQGENFLLFKEMFLTGQESRKFFDLYLKGYDRTFYYFLKELLGMRRFWIEVERLLIQ